jgi:hypothetical protein
MRLVAIFACGLLIMPATVFAQAGSIGGTIAKTDKSLSGSEEQSEPQHGPKSKWPARGAPTGERPSGNACQKIVGDGRGIMC